MNIRSIQGLRVLFALVMVAAFPVLSVAGPAQLALADQGSVKGQTFHVSFTKWGITVAANPPSMAGVYMAGYVGGAVGKGRFAGQVLTDTYAVPGYWLAHALYGFHGEEHSFVADVYVAELLTSPSASVTGRVIKGWLKGAQVTGEWTDYPTCPIATPPTNVWGTECVQGTLTLHVVHGSE